MKFNKLEIDQSDQIPANLTLFMAPLNARAPNCCVFQPVFGCAQHPKAGQNTQHLTHYKTHFFTTLTARIPPYKI